MRSYSVEGSILAAARRGSDLLLIHVPDPHEPPIAGERVELVDPAGDGCVGEVVSLERGPAETRVFILPAALR